MKPIPEIVKEYVIQYGGRMPETNIEIDHYLDLINHAKRYAKAFKIERLIGKRIMKRMGIKTTEQVKKEGEQLK